jgi:catechol 2,3-dioxygenase-like lactoylglutathione lyase family enzyme
VILGPDHLVILVHDLKAAIEVYRRLGFDALPGGEHPNYGSYNALVALANGVYLELLAFKDYVLAESSHWREAVRMLRVSEGFAAHVLGSDDLAGDVVKIRAQAIDIGDPTPWQRLRPDGQTIRWRTAFISGTPTGMMPFLIQDETPRKLRIETPHAGLGARARLSQLVIAVKQLETARDMYRTLLNVEPKHVRNVVGDVEGYRYTMEWGSVVLAQSTVERNAMADQVALRGEGMYGMTLAVDNLGYEWNELNKRGIELERDTNGYLISPARACGARITLVAAGNH